MNTKIEFLLEDVRVGKPLSFDAIYHLYMPLLESMTKNYCKRFSLSESDVDDVRQEAAIALYNAALAYKPTEKTTFGAYAKICVKNRILSYMRQFRGNISSEPFGDREFEPEEMDMETPEQLIINKESLCDLNHKIDGMLTEFERSVFALYIGNGPEGDGMSHEAMSKLLSKPKKSIDNAIHRIKAKLKKLL